MTAHEIQRRAEHISSSYGLRRNDELEADILQLIVDVMIDDRRPSEELIDTLRPVKEETTK